MKNKKPTRYTITLTVELDQPVRDYKPSDWFDLLKADGYYDLIEFNAEEEDALATTTSSRMTPCSAKSR